MSISMIWSVFCCLHLWPMLQIGTESKYKDYTLSEKGATQCIIADCLFSLFLACYARAMLKQPGTTPDTKEWKVGYEPCNPAAMFSKSEQEKRQCKWCVKYKPERSHHCRYCKRCVLKMDHHCPWIMNCVGFANHKFFFLTVMYSAAITSYISFVIYETVLDSANKDMPHVNRFLLVLCFVDSTFFAILMTSFWGFHVWLMLRGMTTIEYCDQVSSGRKGSKESKWDRGIIENVFVVLGDQPLLWFLPYDSNRGDGIHFDKSQDNPTEVNDAIVVSSNSADAVVIAD